MDSPEHVVEAAAGFLLMHPQSQHGVGQGTGELPLPPPGEAQTYWLSLLKRMLRLQCLLQGCLLGHSNLIKPWVQFTHHHAQDKIVILE